MSQSGFEMFSNVAGMVIVIADVIFLYALWNIFCKNKKEKMSMMIGSVLLLLNIGLGFISSLPTSGRLIISAIAILTYSIVRYKKHCEKPVFILTLFYGLRSFSLSVANSVFQYVNNSVFQLLDSSSENYIENMYLYLVYTQILLFGLYIVLFALMLTVVWKIVISFNKMSWYDVWFLSVLNVAGGLFAEVIINISIVKIKNEVFDLFQVKEELLWKLPLIAVLLFLGELAAITIYQKYRELQREKENYFVEQQQIKAMKLRLEEAENFYGSIRKVRHEMKNHMTNIKGLAARDQYEEIDRYIEKLDATIEELDYKYATGNAVTDVLINDKYKKAIREEILFDVKFDYRDSDTISVFDMGMILNNLLDNAIEACRKIEKEKRYIRLSLKRKDNFLLITVENSFDGILQQAEDGLPRTMKETELPEILMEHGVGLRNVRELAERYFGAVNIEAKGNRFKVTVMLQKQQ